MQTVGTKQWSLFGGEECWKNKKNRKGKPSMPTFPLQLASRSRQSLKREKQRQGRRRFCSFTPQPTSQTPKKQRSRGEALMMVCSSSSSIWCCCNCGECQKKEPRPTGPPDQCCKSQQKYGKEERRQCQHFVLSWQLDRYTAKPQKREKQG